MRRLFERLLPVGRRSLLWGVHQFVWHPLAVFLAWRRLYGQWPTWRETVCILIHDWGYWWATDMDGPAGLRHPEFGARLAGWLFGPEYHDLVLYHSRNYAKQAGRTPSKLCWADKASHLYYPAWLYLGLARLSGELEEYRQETATAGHVPLQASDKEWFAWLRWWMATAAMNGDRAESMKSAADRTQAACLPRTSRAG